MDVITSNSNQYVKLVKSLSDKKSRDELGLFMLEGERLIKDLPNDYMVEFLLVSEDKADEYDYLLKGRKYFVCNEKTIRFAADTVSPSGIIAVVKKRKTEFKLPSKNAILLDRVSDPGNIGTIIRTAAAVGFDVYLYKTADVFSPKVVRASMSALFKTDIYEIDFEQVKQLLTKTESYALDMDGDNLFGLKFGGNVTLACGNEAHGLSDEILKLVKDKISIPMKNCMESLNVAVATSVAMYYTIYKQ